MINKVQVVQLNSLGVLSVAGDDAQTFLQGQLTCDVNKLSEGQSTLAAYCTYQGKVVSVFWLVRHDEQYFLMMPKALVQDLQSRLHKYAVFSKVVLQPMLESMVGIGMIGEMGQHVNQKYFSAGFMFPCGENGHTICRRRSIKRYLSLFSVNYFTNVNSTYYRLEQIPANVGSSTRVIPPKFLVARVLKNKH